ncbi:Spectrin beta chain non-erythrocytic 2 [Dissostichus eleginoides]|uniref:Spectrin beta chain non-erythrocytic 2 n=1 Tax=Dissostichus eleginoides TaxID=100907 RepID=A0AAD9EYB4_DISEL|nr:Spectrin beta chain non-erythrocytic 2 [Dissostichus eleginoides]
MSAWICSIISSMPTGSGDSPVGPRALSRAMTMPPISPTSGEGGGVTMRNKDGKDKDREKRFSFFGKKK